jgi:hypothetical protein
MTPESITWNPVTRDYFSDGQTVTGPQLLDDVEETVQASAQYIEQLTAEYTSGQISIAEWQLGIAYEIKLGHTALTVLANGGVGQMDTAAYGKLGSVLKEKYEYLRDFWLQVERGELSDAEIAVRAQLYSLAGYSTYANAVRALNIKSGEFTEERRVDAGDDSVCDGCAAESAKKWQPIGTLKEIGDCNCMVRCRCGFDYR